MPKPTPTEIPENGSAGVLADLREIIVDLSHSRGLIYQLTLRDIRVRYKQAVMGFAWAILSPLLIVGAGTVLRVAMLRMSGQQFAAIDAGGIALKGVMWGFFASTLSLGTTALSGNPNLITKVYFAREVLPLSVVLAGAFDALVGAGAVAIVLPLTGWRPTWAVLWLPFLAVILFTFTLAIVLAVSCANLFYRDVRYLVQVLVSFGIFFVPVFYTPAMLGARWIGPQMANPLAAVLEGARLSVMDGHNLSVSLPSATDGVLLWSPLYLVSSAGTAVLMLAMVAVIFRRAQFRFAEYV
mgnify:CR=1 FL=1